MKKTVIIIKDLTYKPNVIKVMFGYFTKYLHEHGFFNLGCGVAEKPIKTKITTEQLWATLIEDGKHSLVKVLNHVENKVPGYGSIVVPKTGFSNNLNIHNEVITWLNDRGVNIINVENEIFGLEQSLKV